MAQDDYTVANAAGATVRADINSQLAAIVSQNSGAAAPATTFAEQIWYDSTNDILKQRNSANSAWIDLIHFDQTNGLFRIDLDKGADIASAATTDIGAATGNYAVVTGTTTITALGTIKAGTHRWVRFSGALLLTHNGTSLILPGGASITTAAGDVMLAISEGSGNWRVAFYQKADGTPVAPSPAPGSLIGFQVFTTNGTWTPTAGTNAVEIEIKGGGGGGGGADSSGATAGRAAGGGGEGETAIARITAGLGATETITIGAAGTAGSVTGGNGGTGGTTSFGAHVTAIGGSPGVGTTGADAATLGAQGGIGGTGGTGSDIAHAGQAGFPGLAHDSTTVALFGGNGGGPGGRGGGANVAGEAGDSGGGGGGGATTNSTGEAGGAGGVGYVKVWEYS